ncbi:type II toxin-antitoxin system RelE/ParE family toxin [Azospirillum sp. sgz301742]
MSVTWAADTVRDFQRIYLHNEDFKGGDRADEIDDLIRSEGDALTPASGSRWRGGRPGERRKLIRSEGYLLFFRQSGSNVEIFAVAHAKENWSALLEER